MITGQSAQRMDAPTQGGLLGDTTSRDYARKLQLFNAFAEWELRRAIGRLELRPGMRILDAGCGTGEALWMLADAARPAGLLVGMDLAAAHVQHARATAPSGSLMLQADLADIPLRSACVDLVWCVNTLNHLRDPMAGLRALSNLLRPGGRIALGQSSFLPDMFFAWNAPLERRVDAAVRRYYQERYGVSEQDLAGIRSLVGLLRRAGMHHVEAYTFTIERISPLQPVDERYLLDAIFRGTWSERLRSYLSTDDCQELAELCNPEHERFALRRADFHYIQTFTLVVGGIG